MIWFMVILLCGIIAIVIGLNIQQKKKDRIDFKSAVNEYRGKEEIPIPTELHKMRPGRYRELQKRGSRLTNSEFRHWHFCIYRQGKLIYTAKGGTCNCGYRAIS